MCGPSRYNAFVSAPMVHDSPLVSLPEESPVAGWRAFGLLALAALILRVVVAPWVQHSVDMGTFMAWGLHLARVGTRGFWGDGYWCDYLPGYLYVLGAVGTLASGLSEWGLSESFRVLLFKLPNIFADIATAWLIWRVACPREGARKLWLPAAYLFNPAVFANSTLWGQVDSFHALCLTGSLFLLSRRKPVWAAALLGYAASVKPHTVVILPLVIAYALCTRLTWWRVLLCVFVAAIVFVATFVPFHTGPLSDLPSFARGRVETTMGQYGYASVNAMNLWYLLGKNWKLDSEPLIGAWSVRQVSIGLSVLSQVLAIGWYVRRRRTGDAAAIWEAASIIYLCTFLFATRAHERHVFPFFAAAAVVVGFRKVALVPYVLVSVTYCINLGLSWAYLLPGRQTTQLCGAVLGAVVCILNLLALPMSAVFFTRLGADLWVKARAILRSR